MLFGRKKQSEAIHEPDPALLASLKEYIAKKQRKSGKRTEPAGSAAGQTSLPRGEGIRYSLRQPNWFSEETPSSDELARALRDLKGNTSLLDSPGFRKAYRNWEREKAVPASFSSELQRYMGEKNLGPVQFYRAAGLTKQVYYSIKKDYLYKPSRETAIRCCFGLGLNKKEADGLLKLAGYSLSASESRDLAFQFCLENGIHDLMTVNLLLDALEEKPLA